MPRSNVPFFAQYLARIFHELLSRDHEDGRATWQPQELEPEAYLNSTSQGARSKDARKDAHIRGRSHAKAWFMKHPGYIQVINAKRGRAAHSKPAPIINRLLYVCPTAAISQGVDVNLTDEGLNRLHPLLKLTVCSTGLTAFRSGVVHAVNSHNLACLVRNLLFERAVLQFS